MICQRQYALYISYLFSIPKILALSDVLSSYRIVLVDNTPDPTKTVQHYLDKTQKTFPKQVIYIQNGENKGYTGGVNTGLKWAYAHNAEWIVILNDDLEMSVNTVKTFCDYLQQAVVGLVGPFPRYLDKKRWTTYIHGQQSDPDFLSGSFLAVHRKVIDTLGYLYDPYFIFYEEVEYCVRAKKIGFPLQPVVLNGIDHEESSSFKNISFHHQYYLARNHFLFIERNAPMAVKIYELIRFPKTMYEHISRKEFGALLGIRDYFIRRFGRLRQDERNAI